MAADLPILLFGSLPELEVWLEANHAGSAGLWLKIAKKGSGVESVTYAEALELALCFGWIDSQKRGFDERPCSCSASRRGARAASGRRSTARRPKH